MSFCATAPADSDWRELAGVYFAVTDEKVVPLRKLISPQPETTDHVVLSGTIWMPPSHQYGRVQELHSFSDFVHQKQLENLRQLVASHRDWSETHMANALKEAGAHFGPNDQEAFLSSLPLGKAERFLGKLKIDRVRFEYPSSHSSGQLNVDGLDWVVEAVGELPDGTHPRYSFIFEPFDGKLISLFQSLDR